MSEEEEQRIHNILSTARQESACEIRDLVGGDVQREVSRLQNVYFRIRHVAVIRLGLRLIKGQVVLPPKNQKARLGLLHPCLPLWIRIDVRAIVVE
jgi:hypothetical protein